MHNGDVLGDEGRKALDACVKVKIFGKPETRRYDQKTALSRLKGCHEWPFIAFRSWWTEDEFMYSIEFDRNGYNMTTYNIVDIHDALVNFDKTSYVKKYPKEGAGSDKLRNLIDKRRADVERELEEARTDPDGRHRYSWIVAQRRVRDCYAGNFQGDLPLLHSKGYDEPCNITDIHDVVAEWDKLSFPVAADRNIQHTAYSRDQVEEQVSLFCSPGNYLPALDLILPVESQSYDILEVLAYLDGKKMLDKYPEEGPGSDELKKLIDAHRDDLNKEYQQASQQEYSKSEAEHRVRDCFAGSFLKLDTDVFPTKKDQSEVSKISQTFDIFDIKEALDHFDTRKLYEKYPEKKGPEYDKIKKSVGGDEQMAGIEIENIKQSVDEQRAGIKSEYITATTNIEIEHGSGFIVRDHFIITNKHVIETLNETEKYEIRISNAAIDDLPCKVAHSDPGKDLALLYCPELNVEQSGICPLQLSNQSLLPGMSIFSFGYPMSHTGETALFVNGNVSGSKETFGRPPMVVLNCSLNSGNSGGPVLCWVNGQLKVVGVATQKHFKEILTLEERVAIEKIRKSLQTHAIPDAIPEYVETKVLSPLNVLDLPSRSYRNSMFLLTLKLYDALETHSQFNLSNALPGHLVVEFIKNYISEYTEEDKEELAEIVKLSSC